MSNGLALKLQRVQQRKSLKSIAERLGVSSSFLSAVENGYKEIPKDRIQEFKKAYEGDYND